MKRKNKSWYKPKGYLHISPKLKEEQKGFVLSYIKEKLESHNFFPLIHETIATRRFKAYLNEKGDVYRSHFDSIKKKPSKKLREIFYANHLDAHIYSYFSNEVLGKEYEKLLGNNLELSDAITAYRKIPVNPSESQLKCKCNIHFASEVFTEISSRGDCVVACYDIENFFPSLDHGYLKECWQRLLGVEELSKIDKKVLKSLTNYSYVEMTDVISACSVKELGISHKNDFMNSDLNSYFISARDFREKIAKKHLIRKHKPTKPDEQLKGIPQGTPISAFLANLYLYEFDKFVVDELVKKENCFYRRYSDDIVIIFENIDQFENWNNKLVKKISTAPIQLKINEQKTVISKFTSNDNILTCATKVELREDYSRSHPLKYLGFEFDGKKIQIKQASLAKFYRDMKYAIKAKSRKARIANRHNMRYPKRKRKSTKLYLTKIYRRFTHLGKNKAKSNYLRYVDRAANEMFPQLIGKRNPIRKQHYRAWRIFSDTIKKYEL
jgi:hypothetical protein